MGNTEKITGRILDDARQEAETILKEAAARAQEIRSKGERDAAVLGQNAAQEAEEAAETLKTRLSSAAQLEARKRLLQEKQSLVERAFLLAQQKLLELPREEYAAYLAKLAADSAVTGTEALILNGRDRAELGENVVSQANALRREAGASAGLTLSDETRPMAGGLILSQGDVESNCTVETLLGALRETMAGQVAKLLLQ